MRRVSRLKMKLIPSPARFAAWGFSFGASPLRKYVTPIVRGPQLSHQLALSNWLRARTYRPPLIPDTERERQGQVALYLLRLHSRYP